MAVWRRSKQQAEEALAATIEGPPVQGARQLQRATKTGDWMTVQPYRVNGTELGSQEWCDALFLQYGLETPDIPKYCDSCNAKFTICHTLDCKRGGLVMARHNELRDGVVDLVGRAFTPSHVHDDTLIFAGYAVKRLKDNPAGTSGSTYQEGAPTPEDTEQKGALLIRDL